MKQPKISLQYIYFFQICEVGGLAITHKKTSKFGYKLDKKI
jgi:hypothetical protein